MADNNDSISKQQKLSDHSESESHTTHHITLQLKASD